MMQTGKPTSTAISTSTRFQILVASPAAQPQPQTHVYLQNKHHSIYGDSLVPWQANDLDGNNMLNSLDNAIAVALKLSEDKFIMIRTMHTTNHQFLATGIARYIESVAPGKTVYSAMDSEA